MGCVRETPQIIMKPARDMQEKIPQIKKRSQYRMCKRNSPQKNKASMGCVRETYQIKMKLVWDV